jgi:sigma-B regulation protein RsbU (phosphoserine phosphatase)
MSGTKEPLLKISVPADPSKLRDIRAQVKAVAKETGCCDQVADQLVLAVNEACTNVMRHAYKGRADGQIEVEVSRAGETLVFHIVDYAEPVDIASIHPRDLDKLSPSGLGTYFISKIMDEFHYGHLNDTRGNFLYMKKRIA